MAQKSKSYLEDKFGDQKCCWTSATKWFADLCAHQNPSRFHTYSKPSQDMEGNGWAWRHSHSPYPLEACWTHSSVECSTPQPSLQESHQPFSSQRTCNHSANICNKHRSNERKNNWTYTFWVLTITFTFLLHKVLVKNLRFFLCIEIVMSQGSYGSLKNVGHLYKFITEKRK